MPAARPRTGRAAGPRERDQRDSRINAASGASTAVSPATAALVAASLDAAHRTGGAFDPTVYPLTSAWASRPATIGCLPDEVAALLPCVATPPCRWTKRLAPSRWKTARRSTWAAWRRASQPTSCAPCCASAT
ncbi:MAG: FAD:protein FMN transferase [Eggerthella lenta]